jgi:hypothetical protein
MTIQTLRKENADLNQAGAITNQKILDLEAENLRLSQENAKFERRTSRLHKRSLKRYQDLKALQARAKWDEPLVKVGIAIRRRFWEQVKELRNSGVVDKSIVDSGNNAACRGDVLADTSMIFLGHLISAPPGEASVHGNSPSQVVLEEQLFTLYNNCYRPELQQEWSLCSRELEIFNMTATITSRFATYYANYATGSKPCNPDDANPGFNKLAQECVEIYIRLSDEFPSRTDTQKAFETDPDAGEKIREMRVLVDRAVGLDIGRDQDRLTPQRANV